MLSMKDEQTHIASASQNHAQASEIIGQLAAHAAAFPLTTRAMRTRCAGRGVDPADPVDFGLMILAPALQALRAQEHILIMLRNAVNAAASTASSAG